MLEKPLLATLIALVLGFTVTFAQDNLCMGCEPNDVITSETVLNSKINGGFEARPIDMSVSTHNHRLLFLEQGQLSGRWIVDIIKWKYSVNTENLYGWSPGPVYESLDPLKSETGEYTQVALSPDGLWAVIGSQTGELVWYQLLDELLLIRIDTASGSIQEILFDAEGTGVFVQSGESGLQWYGVDGTTIDYSVPPLLSPIQHIALNKDASQLAIASLNSVQVMDTISGQFIAESDFNSPIQDMTFNPQNSNQLILLTDTPEVWIIHNDELVLDFRFEQNLAESLTTPDYTFVEGTINPNGDLLVTIDNFSFIRFWSLVDETEIGIPFNSSSQGDIYRDGLLTLAFSGDGKILFVSSVERLGTFIVP